MRFDGIANRLAYQVGIGRPMVIYGSGEQVRPLIHIGDASAALRFCLAEPKTAGQTINAVGVNPSINQIADVLQTIVPDTPVRYTDQDILTEISYRVNSTKLIEMGFQPQFGLEQGLQEMVARWRGFRAASRAEVAAIDALE
jgi:nucleoside-diphosphate-sugar epimerase